MEFGSDPIIDYLVEYTDGDYLFDRWPDDCPDEYQKFHAEYSKPEAKAYRRSLRVRTDARRIAEADWFVGVVKGLEERVKRHAKKWNIDHCKLQRYCEAEVARYTGEMIESGKHEFFTNVGKVLSPDCIQRTRVHPQYDQSNPLRILQAYFDVANHIRQETWDIWYLPTKRGVREAYARGRGVDPEDEAVDKACQRAWKPLGLNLLPEGESGRPVGS